MKINGRIIKLILLKLRNLSFNKNTFKYIHNRCKKLLFNPHKQLHLPYPTGLMLELGNRCNLHCIICPREYYFGKQMNQGFMKPEQVYKIVDEIYPYLDSIGLTGLGETFLYPELLEVCKYIKEKRKDIIITLSTNAHFKNYLEKALPVMPYIDSLQISVDGIGETYEAIRPNTDFNYIANNIRELVKASKNTVIMLNTVITIENYKHLLPIVEFAHQVGIKYVNFNYINLASIPEKRQQYNDFFKSSELEETINEFIRESAAYTDVNITIPNLEHGNGCFQNCDALWHHHYITWDGYLVPCCAKPFPKELHLGNVFEEGSLMKVLNGEKAKKLRKLWQENKTIAFCNECNAICGY